MEEDIRGGISLSERSRGPFSGSENGRLFFSGHSDGALGTDERADSAAFAKVVVNLNVAGLLISGDAKIRAKVAAQVATSAKIVPKAAARLHDRRLLIKTRLDLVKVFGGLLFLPVPDFQFTRFSHPDLFRLTTEPYD